MQIPVVVRGGVLADAVGYGKTAITLALIDAQWRDQAPEPLHMGKAFPVRPLWLSYLSTPWHSGQVS